RAGPTRAWTVIGLTIVYATVFQVLGYVLATLLYTGAVAERFGARRRTILVLAPGVTLLTYVLFRVVLGARLPEGLLG
ncbi:MAG: tripartite tricarboxylate transporter TctB family protein, partial [Gammaproteobacteria bacterium]|nr:tripartite tricarboxylate transporter TctB family protein [Gammaproteobacteria bacterium]